ncbi:MAG: hypothetical protein A3K03_08085 [Bdellovibrionales bacterium RIFOXYD1_FULL_44_7]|nr:MAG: hypothetical protein A3K03_08085 [Bdellovibrionales bacterium RIFOXYD1_FULL_44_7]
MIRLFLRAINAPTLILLVAIGVALQTSLFSSYPLMYLQPDVVLIAVIWCALKRNFIEGGILTLIFANIAEIHSAAPQGLFFLTYMFIYLLVRATARVLVMPNLASLILVTMCSSIVWKFSYMGVLHLLGDASNQWRHLLSLLFPGAVMEGVIGIWLYRMLERFDWVTYKNIRARQQLEDELQLDSEGL